MRIYYDDGGEEDALEERTYHKCSNTLDLLAQMRDVDEEDYEEKFGDMPDNVNDVFFEGECHDNSLI